jgi:hypothetical protein
MKAKRCFLVLSIAVLAGLTPGQETTKLEVAKPLVLTGAIPLPNVLGRIDHFGFDRENRLFLSAIGNNTEEIIDLGAQKVVHTIVDVPAPQGVVYSPETNRLFVASAKGKLYIYDGTSFDQLRAEDFGGDVDNLRYTAADKRVYVGYGDDETAAIAMVDAATNRRLAGEFKLGAHPESFQVEESGPNIYVNLPDLKQIAVVNRKTGAVSRWSLTLEANFPMALDEANHRLFVATRGPARMAVFDTSAGHLLAALPCAQDADDLFYDAQRRRIYVSGGEGFISVIKQRDADHYEPLAKVPTAVGARTSGYFGKLGKKAFDRLYVAVPARTERGAEVLIYTVQD